MAMATRASSDLARIIVSEHALLLDRAVDVLRADIDEGLREFNFEMVDAKQGASRIIGMCETLPMMADKRAVVGRDIGAMPAAELDAFAAYFEAPCESTRLLLVRSEDPTPELSDVP